jgi:hypothetical protein
MRRKGEFDDLDKCDLDNAQAAYASINCTSSLASFPLFLEDTRFLSQDGGHYWPSTLAEVRRRVRTGRLLRGLLP